MPMNENEWLASEFASLPVALDVLRPSEWAEAKRSLPRSVAEQAGRYDYSVTPYLREIVDCLDVRSPIREVTVMKGVQLGATTGVLENCFGYVVDHVRTSPMMVLCPDDGAAKDRVDGHLNPMLRLSGLDHLIKSSDERNKRKTGQREGRIEWSGGGYALVMGVQNPANLRSTPVRFLLRDEVDEWPAEVGAGGDPMLLSRGRTTAFEATRKILDLSTPTLKGQSNIEKRFLLGDQRHYYVRCLQCGEAQRLRWWRASPEGEVTGVDWEPKDGGPLDRDSVVYKCKFCGHPHRNEDKPKLLSPLHGAHWRAHATPVNPYHRSYHISALYSPFRSWADCVVDYMQGWDVATGHMRDQNSYRVFYNEVLGESFELRGQKITFENVSAHRRSAYHYGQIPNRWASKSCGSRVLLLICTVDVHGDGLHVAVWGWCRDKRVLLIDYWKFEGNTENLDTPSTWGRLRELIENKHYVADDGTHYPFFATTFIDAGYLDATVGAFVASGVLNTIMINGITPSPKERRPKDVEVHARPEGGFRGTVAVTRYKNRWASALRRDWDGQSVQPAPFFNAPLDATDDQLRQLTREVQRIKVNRETGKKTVEWHRPGKAPNELWDLLVYSTAALDHVAQFVSMSPPNNLPGTDWALFWDTAATPGEFWDSANAGRP